MTKAQRSVSPADEAAFATLEVELGGRARLVAVLGSAQLPKDMQAVLGMIADPIHDHESLAKICALGNVSLAKIQKTFESAAMTRAHVLATARIAARTPDLASAVMDDAIPGMRECRGCGGLRTVMVQVKDQDGTREESKECPACKGTGLVFWQPDHEVQKTALKLAKLIETGRGGLGSAVNIAMLQANTNSNPGDTGSYDGMMTKLDDVLYGTGRERMKRSKIEPEDEVVEGEALVE